jgi:predicted HAD superfamily Cof-like phosphohydrolase
MERQILQVKQFQEAFGVDLPKRPTLLPMKRAAFRQVLLEEEVDEIRRGFESKDIVQVADGVIDSMYILIGTAHEYGFADRLPMLFDEVHRSNMSKMGPDGKAIFREDGKVMKPDTYSPPKLAIILQRDFSLYTENETLKEIAEIEKKVTENKIKHTIVSKLRFIDRLLFKIYDKIENRLNKKVEVDFPVTSDGKIVVQVYGKKHEIN